MFWFLAVGSMFGYAIQGTLFARYARDMDGLSAGFYRNATFLVTLTPMLLFVPADKWADLPSFLGLIFVAGFLGAISQWTRFLSLKIFPVGIHAALSTGLTVIFSLIGGFLLFEEKVLAPTIIAVALILLGSSILALKKTDFPHLKAGKISLGLFWIFLTAGFVTAAFLIVADVARELDPFLSGFFWEIFIGVASFIMILMRQGYNGKTLEKIPFKKLALIALVSWPTIIGTTGFALASQMGNVGIVAAIGAAGILVSTFISHFLYHEKLKPLHWIAICLIIGGIVGLKVF